MMKLHSHDFDWITPYIAVVIVDPSSAQHWQLRSPAYWARNWPG